MSAVRWLSRGDWAAAHLSGLTIDRGALVLDSAATGFVRRGIGVIPAGAPSPAQMDSTSADRWRAVHVRIDGPPPPECWLRIWIMVEAPGGLGIVPAAPEPATADDDRAPVPTAPGRWRAAALGALDARVLCPARGPVWVAIELGGPGIATAAVADLRVDTGDDGPVTDLPVIYRRTAALGAGEADSGPARVSGQDEIDGGDGVLGRYLGLLASQLERTSSILTELPALLSPAVTPDRDDAPWLRRLSQWVALDPELLPADDASRRETVASATERHGWRGTRRGLLDQVRRETGLTVQIVEPLTTESVWRLGEELTTSALGLTTGLISADPGPSVLDRSAVLDAAMLIDSADAGLPVHARVAHRICVHVPDGTVSQVAAVDRVVQRERPAHVLARTCATTADTRLPTQVGVDALPGPGSGPRGLPNDTVYHPHVDGPGHYLGTARLPADPSSDPHQAHSQHSALPAHPEPIPTGDPR